MSGVAVMRRFLPVLNLQTYYITFWMKEASIYCYVPFLLHLVEYFTNLWVEHYNIHDIIYHLFNFNGFDLVWEIANLVRWSCDSWPLSCVIQPTGWATPIFVLHLIWPITPQTSSTVINAQYDQLLYISLQYLSTVVSCSNI